jgi:hypothetical protein
LRATDITQDHQSRRVINPSEGVIQIDGGEKLGEIGFEISA